MLNRTMILALTLIIITATGCGMLGTSSKQISIVGEWAGYAQDGSSLKLVFEPDRTLSATMGGQFTLTGKYRLDQSTRPMSLDFSNFSDAEFSGSQYYAIVEFITYDTLKMQGNFVAPGNPPRRPRLFTEECFDLKRVAQ